MKLRISTDYAIRIVLYLAKCEPRVVSAPTISGDLNITYPYFTKIASTLKRAGLIESVIGNSGGYCIGKSADSISLYDIICVMQGPISLNRCLEQDGVCSRYGTECGRCPVHRVLKDFQGDMVSRLKEQTIESLCEMGTEISAETYAAPGSPFFLDERGRCEEEASGGLGGDVPEPLR